MTVVATVAVPTDAFVLGEILAVESVRIELTQFVPVDDGLVPYFWVSGDHDTEAFERRVAEDPRVDAIERLDGRIGQRLYRVAWSEGIDGLLDALGAPNVLVEEAVGTTAEWLFSLRTDDRETLRRFQRDCEDADVPVELRRAYHNPMEADEAPFGLTEKQREALSLAVTAGYFEVPREASLDDLAGRLDISRQSFARRLQRAEREVFSRVMAETDALG